MNNLNAQEFKEILGKPEILILDVRTPDEYSQGHIQGSSSLDYYLESFPAEILKLDREKTYAIYCRSGQRSGDTAHFMSENGFNSVYNLSGGIISWVNAGNQLVTN
jgi:rhodanese-related sulfurtransferase